MSSQSAVNFLKILVTKITKLDKTNTKGMNNNKFHQNNSFFLGNYQPPPPAPEKKVEDSDKKINDNQLLRLKAQIAAYRHLARNEAIPPQVMVQATASALPAPYEYPKELENGEKLPYDLMKIFALHLQRSNQRTTSITQPIGIDPAAIAKERENR